MAVFALRGNDAADKRQGYASYLDAITRSLEAVRRFPLLESQVHTTNIFNVLSEVVAFTGFKIRRTANSSNLYETHRFNIKDFVIPGPGTSLKFDCSNQRNFTQDDANELDMHLTTMFPFLDINVHFGVHKPRFVVHIKL